MAWITKIHAEDPCISAAKAPADRAGEANVIARINVVFCQQLRPAGITSHAFASDHGRKEIRFKQPRARPPNVEITVAACFEQKELTDQKTDEHHGQGGCLSAAVGRRQSNARRDCRPVGRAVQPRAPNRASVDFTSVEMSKCANLCDAELRLSSGWKRRLVRIG